MKKQIFDALSKLLTKKLEAHKSSKLDDATCKKIYVDVFDTLVEVFKGSDVKLSNEAMNLVAQMYYDSIKINGRHELDPNIFEQRASPKNVDTKELALLATAFSGTPFADIFIYEVKRRS